MDLNEIAVFIKVVQSESFTKAAQCLGMPKSTVSQKVSMLEKRLGVTLIQRTTRKLNITPLGKSFYSKCVAGLEEIKSAEMEIASVHSEPQGLLRITAPIDLGGNVLPPLISSYMASHPKVRVEVILTDRRVDLLSENIDLAIRAGELQDSSMIVKNDRLDLLRACRLAKIYKKRMELQPTLVSLLNITVFNLQQLVSISGNSSAPEDH